METQKKPLFYRFVWETVRLFYPRWRISGTLPEAPSIVVGNHSQAHGPIFSELYFPGKRYIWCAGQMMDARQVPDYAYHDFWCDKPRWSQPFYRLLSYLIAPFAAEVMRSADTIPVYRDTRIIHTFKQTVERLRDGHHIIIFPECRQGYNQIVCRFQENFVDVAKLYYSRTGEELLFVPMYLAPSLRTAFFGTPIRYDHRAGAARERARISRCMMEEITRMAVSLPEHTVVPYPNIPKKNYHTNFSNEVIIHETAGG